MFKTLFRWLRATPNSVHGIAKEVEGYLPLMEVGAKVVDMAH